jgi:hypothetical protein
MKSRQTSGTGRTGKHPVGLTQHRSAISRSNPEGRSMATLNFKRFSHVDDLKAIHPDSLIRFLEPHAIT